MNNDDDKRLLLDSAHAFEDGMTVVVAPDGSLIFGVTEEQAVDSYNQPFTCNFTATKEQVSQLAEFLAKFLDKHR